MIREEINTSRICAGCNSELSYFNSYRHPVEGNIKYVCGNCWDKIEFSEREYGSFISREISNKKKGCICYILISTAPAKEYNVYNNLIEIPELVELHPLLGWYDIIIKINIENSKNLGDFVLNKIRNIKGITDTRTLTGSFSLSGN